MGVLLAVQLVIMELPHRSSTKHKFASMTSHFLKAWFLHWVFILKILMHHLVIVFPLTVCGIYRWLYIFLILHVLAILIKYIQWSELNWLKTLFIPRLFRNAVMGLHYFLWCDIICYCIFEFISIKNHWFNISKLISFFNYLILQFDDFPGDLLLSLLLNFL